MSEYMVVPCLINGLGNRLFIYAAAYGTARRYNRRLTVLCSEVLHSEHITAPYDFFFGEPQDIQNMFYYLCDTSYFGGPLDDHNYIMKGYYLSTSLWAEYAHELRAKWRCPPEKARDLEGKYGAKNALFLHVRRGDFVGKHYELDLDLYYATCLSRFSGERVLICSNDIGWCRESTLFKDIDAMYVEEDEISTLFLMSICGLGGICANSTFSWWGAFLNEVAPDGTLFFPSQITRGANVYRSLFLETRLAVIDIFSGQNFTDLVDM